MLALGTHNELELAAVDGQRLEAQRQTGENRMVYRAHGMQCIEGCIRGDRGRFAA